MKAMIRRISNARGRGSGKPWGEATGRPQGRCPRAGGVMAYYFVIMVGLFAAVVACRLMAHCAA